MCSVSYKISSMGLLGTMTFFPMPLQGISLLGSNYPFPTELTISALSVTFTWHKLSEQDNKGRPPITFKWLLSNILLNQLE